VTAAREADMSATGQADAARAGAGVAPLSGWPLFAVVGKDAVELLQRLSTNDLAVLTGGQAVTTLLLSPLGRILFRVHLQPVGGALRALCPPGTAASFPAWIDRYTFGEDARVQLLDGAGALAVVGPRAGEVVASVAGDGSRDVEAAGVAISTWSFGVLPGRVVTGPAAALAPLAQRLAAAGALELDAAGFEQLGVEVGPGAAGAEHVEAYHPLEAGLADDVSFTKGCYTGQEVVARQDTYGKVARRLVRLRCARRPEIGVALGAEAREGCCVTTVAPEGRPDGWPCLGYVRMKEAVPGATLGTASGIAARVVDLVGAHARPR
jgi:folate-binding protein YgfZ